MNKLKVIHHNLLKSIVSPPTAFRKNKKKIATSLVMFAAVACSTLGLALLLIPQPLRSPVSFQDQFAFLSNVLGVQSQSEKIVYGFLPYWEINNADLNQTMTTVSYFSLSIDQSGQIITLEDGGAEPGFRVLQSPAFNQRILDAARQRTNLEITITQFNSETLALFLSNQAAQETFFEELKAVFQAYPFTGLNIDFEPANGGADQRDDFTQFIAALDLFLAEELPYAKMSVSTYAAAAGTHQIWDIAKLSPHVDFFVMMAYDYHRPSSPIAGPVAPVLSDETTPWNKNITQHLAEFLQQTEPNKILLGLPFYGYQWQVVDADKKQTIPQSGSTIRYRDTKNFFSNQFIQPLHLAWDDVALSPYFSYSSNGENYIAYYENELSLSYKLDFVRQLNLRGVAIWAVGYEGDNSELWDIINGKIRQ